MKVVEKDSKLRVHYTGNFDNGKTFDSSRGVNESGETVGEPLEIELGKGLLIPGFENALVGMSEGETKKVTIQSSEAYGEPKEELIQEVEKQYVPEGVTEGQLLQTETDNGAINVVVKEVKEGSVILDANHPLAGHTLNFDIEIVEVL